MLGSNYDTLSFNLDRSKIYRNVIVISRDVVLRESVYLNDMSLMESPALREGRGVRRGSRCETRLGDCVCLRK